ncbi:MAG: hypothetical protein KJZ91_13310 [Myxococcales bacterium]|nr:hypothetical protein [Myxococcales bacterium]
MSRSPKPATTLPPAPSPSPAPGARRRAALVAGLGLAAVAACVVPADPAYPGPGPAPAGATAAPPGGPVAGGGPAPAGATVAPVEAHAGELAAPLSGARVTIDGTAMTVVMPAGWRGAWQGDEAYMITPTDGRTQALIAASAHPLSAEEATRSIQALLRSALADLDPQLQVARVETFTVRGRAGARAVGRTGDREVLATALRVDGWVIALVAVHAPAAAAAVRAVSDTLVATLDGAPAAGDGAAAAAAAGTGGAPPELVGCWRFQYVSRGGGGGSQTIQVAFGEDGRYRWRVHTAMPGWYQEPTLETGRYAARGDRVELVADDGRSAVMRFARAGGALVLDGSRYLPSSCP